MKTKYDETSNISKGIINKFIYMSIFAIIFFHFAPILIVRNLNLFEFNTDINEYLFNTLIAFLLFLIGLRFYSNRKRKVKSKRSLFLKAYAISKIIILITFPIILPWSIYAMKYTFEFGYGSVDPISTSLNIIMYVPLTVIPFILIELKKKREAKFLLLLIIIPRVFISVFGPRFFLLQALIPTFLYIFSLNKIWNFKIISIFITILILVVLIIPKLRGDNISPIKSIALGSPINIINIMPKKWEFHVSGITPICGIFPDVLIGKECIKIRKLFSQEEFTGMDQALTKNLRLKVKKKSIGTGGNPIIESGSYLNKLNLLWFFLIGLITSSVIHFLHRNFLSCILFPHVLTKSLFLWRGSITEFFDRIPLLVLVAILVFLAVKTLPFK